MLSKINSPEDLKKLNPKQLNRLARKIRKFLLKNICQTGGHLASNLGIVEITLALHKFLNLPRDQIIWDVGHQTYVHKILTGRKHKFTDGTFRKKQGISGFPSRQESKYDSFGTGHASTSISAAMGMAEAFKKQKKKRKVVAVIGDGALTGGLALEAINQIGYLQSKVIIILNDNRMSISENVGALCEYTKRIEMTEIYKKVKEKLSSLIKENQDDPDLSHEIKSLKKAFKKVGTPGLLFEKLGINYIGPVEGHTIKEIIQALQKADQAEGPVLIHVRTKKGLGYSLAETFSDKYHGISPFSLETGKELKEKKGSSFSDTFGQKILALAQKDKKIVALTAAMPTGTGLAEFANKLPDQFYDVGICESHAVTFAAGLATAGLKPVVAIYSTFLQRSFDQIVHDVCLQNLPVIFTIDRAGFVGLDGPTHHGVYDISYLRSIPNLILMAPKDNQELAAMLELALRLKKPVAIRYPRAIGTPLTLPRWVKATNPGSVRQSGNTSGKNQGLKLDRSELIFEGEKMIIVTVGNQLEKAFAIAERQKTKPTIINARFLKPIDPKIIKAIKKTPNVVIIEENVKAGGFGSAILEKLAAQNIQAKVKLIGVEDEFVRGDELDVLREKFIR